MNTRKMLNRIESITTKFRIILDAEKHVIQAANREVARAMQDATRVLRIMIFLHSAKDLPTVLRLYGMEGSSETK